MFVVVCCDNGRRVVVLVMFFRWHLIERSEIENFPLFSGLLHHCDRPNVLNNNVIVNLFNFVNR